MREQRLAFSYGTYRPQRREQVDCIADGYVHRLPPAAKAWMEEFLLEAYACDSRRLREGLHADRLTPAQLSQLPARLRRWWGLQLELWPRLATDAGMRALGLNPSSKKDRATLDSSLRRGCYSSQNTATRDVYSLGRVVYAEDREDSE